MYSNGNFRFIRVESEDLKRAIYELRYQIYVEEFGFERPEDHPNKLEIDQYDSHSVYMAALDTADRVVGTARLILHSEHGFPIEHAIHLQYPGAKPPLEYTAEISRLAISRTYRRRADDGQYGVESYLKVTEGGVLSNGAPMPESYARRQQPRILLGMCALIWQTSKYLGLTHWYMISEKKLWNTLYKYGMLFHQIGEPLEYHGMRIPYIVSLAEFEHYLRRINPPLYEMFLSGLELPYHPEMISVLAKRNAYSGSKPAVAG